MKCWQFLRFTSARELVGLAQVVEGTASHGVMLGDHTLFPETIHSHYPYSKDGRVLWDADTEWPDVWTAIAAMATATTRIHFSTSVVVLPLRNPFELARTIATLSQLSSGRYALGAGVGWMEEEFQAVGVDFATRGQRYDEMLEVMKLLWTGEMVEYHGKHFDFPPSMLSPQPQGRVPIYLAGGSKAAMRRAARHADGWIAGNFTTDTAGAVFASMRQLLDDEGRGGSDFEIIASCPAKLDLYKQLRDLGVDAIVDLPSRSKVGPTTSFEQKADYVKWLAETVYEPMNG